MMFCILDVVREVSIQPENGGPNFIKYTHRITGITVEDKFIGSVVPIYERDRKLLVELKNKVENHV